MKIVKEFLRTRKPSGQSFVELALILPLILLMLAGMVEVAFGMFAYLTALDLTREAARFASVRDYNVLEGDPSTACTDDFLHFYYDSACFFTDSDLNPYLVFDAARFDDVVITVYTVSNNNISQRHPDADGWSLNGDNWKKDCDGNEVRSGPALSDEFIEGKLAAGALRGAPVDRGIVSIEAWVCYDLALNLPFISNFIPSPYRIHTYTIMPAPEALPTPTPIP